MIKKGDKVVCIKNISHISRIAPNYYIYKYNTNHQYEVKSVGNFSLSCYIITDDIKDEAGVKAESLDKNGLNFVIKHERTVNRFADYFITLEEWQERREQQIKSILDD